MKRIPQILLLAAAVFAAAYIKAAQPSTDHTPRDGDRLHPGFADSGSLILSVNDSSRSVLIAPSAVSFDEDADAWAYVDADASRIQQATLETVSYYDTYTFASALDSRLVKASPVTATGLQTGSVVYASDGGSSKSAAYYDVKGQVTESREITYFGTLRTTANTYTYTGQPLKTTVTDGDVTTVTENTYDAKSGLLTATDVTVNGTKQRVSAVTYDDLGRISSVARGGTSLKGGTVSYTYNIHGQTKSINGPGLIQNLYYTDGPGSKLYNGSVSAMTWTMGSDATVRGYRYSYHGYGWLTSAEDGEGSSLTSNKDRYTEKSTAFTRNGGIRGLQRHGLTAAGTYGKVDELSVSYSGNRINGVSDGAPAVTQNGSMDFPGGITSKTMTYNAFGALATDAARGITSVTYDDFGNPLRTGFSGGGYTENTYSATGEKLKTILGVPVTSTGSSLTAMGRTVMTYRGNVVYRNGIVDMVLFPGGYATVSGSTVTFHYYTQDYLGNNRAVINGSTGAIEQLTAYYPYGGIIADLGTVATAGQPYRFGGKELITANGLNEYDFGGRQYYSAVPGFTKPDRMAEKYPWLSPYLYCANNPVNAIDPDGNIVIFVNGFHCGDGGRSEYWNGVDTSIQQVLNDDHTAYIDGSFGGVVYAGTTMGTLLLGCDCSNLSASNRYWLGYDKGKNEAERIYKKIRDNETIKIITHSMGAVAAKGFAKALLQYAASNNLDSRIILELDLAPFEWWAQAGNKEIPNYTISHWYDIVAGASFMRNSVNFRTHSKKSDFNPLDEHSIDSFNDDVKTVLDGILKGIESGEIELYLDGKRLH